LRLASPPHDKKITAPSGGKGNAALTASTAANTVSSSPEISITAF
jgi:hypothetical protein